MEAVEKNAKSLFTAYELWVFLQCGNSWTLMSKNHQPSSNPLQLVIWAWVLYCASPEETAELWGAHHEGKHLSNLDYI